MVVDLLHEEHSYCLVTEGFGYLTHDLVRIYIVMIKRIIPYS